MACRIGQNVDPAVVPDMTDRTEAGVDVVGVDQTDWQDDHVHTVDIWYSGRRRCWVVERLNHHGGLVGSAHCSPTFEDAEACVADWLRAHGEAHLTAARGPSLAAARGSVARPKSKRPSQDDSSATDASKMTITRRRRAA